MLPQSRLTELWRAGYCSSFIEKIKHTGPNDQEERFKILGEHIKQCDECEKANIMKNLEFKTAQSMGPIAYALFTSGGNITSYSNFTKHFHIVMKEFKNVIPKDFPEWHEKIKKERANKEYSIN